MTRTTDPTDRCRPRRPIVLAAVAVSTLLAASACSSTPTTSAQPEPGASGTAEPTGATPPDDTTSPDGTFPPEDEWEGQRYDIGGGRMMYMACKGEGSPTVVLISGSGTASDLWHAEDQEGPNVYDDVASYTRVCAYDRPGTPHLTGELSRSDAVAQPTSAVSGADDLTALLDVAGIDGPYVIAAHSFGGNIARVFASDHPDQVEGVVFVDILTPELRASMTPEQWAQWVDANARRPVDLEAYPDLEFQDFDQSLDQVETADPLRPMPMVVLTASTRFADLVPMYIDEGLLPPSLPRDYGVMLDAANTEAQNRLAALVPGARHVTDTDAGHNIMIDNAPVVIESIRDVWDAARAERTSLS